MSKYESQVILEYNENKITITAGSQSVEGWPEETINKLLDVLQEDLKGFVITDKDVEVIEHLKGKKGFYDKIETIIKLPLKTQLEGCPVCKYGRIEIGPFTPELKIKDGKVGMTFTNLRIECLGCGQGFLINKKDMLIKDKDKKGKVKS